MRRLTALDGSRGPSACIFSNPAEIDARDDARGLWPVSPAGSWMYYTMLIYLSGKGGAKDASEQAFVGGETVFYDQRGGVVAEVLKFQNLSLCNCITFV
jgi:hypothetical protein